MLHGPPCILSCCTVCHAFSQESVQTYQSSWSNSFPFLSRAILEILWNFMYVLVQKLRTPGFVLVLKKGPPWFWYKSYVNWSNKSGEKTSLHPATPPRAVFSIPKLEQIQDEVVKHVAHQSGIDNHITMRLRVIVIWVFLSTPIFFKSWFNSPNLGLKHGTPAGHAVSVSWLHRKCRNVPAVPLLLI